MGSLLRRGLPNVPVTTLPLDRASSEGGSARLNLFLYHTMPNAAWRNQPMPDRVGPSGHGRVPLALSLYYLVTAFGDDEGLEQPYETDHQLLGRAMTLFHSRPILLPDDIRNAINPDADTSLSASDLHQQVEHVRLTPETLSVDDMMKLWGTFHQSPYRISSAWQASVVLLERIQMDSIAFPVFYRGGESDPGPDVQASMQPKLETVEYRDVRSDNRELSAARVGDVITVRGSNLKPQDSVLVLYDSKQGRKDDQNSGIVARYGAEEGSNSERFIVSVVESPALVSGRLVAVVETPDFGAQKRLHRTNPLELRLAPRLTSDDAQESFFNGSVAFTDSTLELSLICTPPPGPKRQILLYLTPTDDRPEPPPIDAIVDSNGFLDDEVRFNVDGLVGRYRVRLSVDSVESLPLRRIGDGFEFDQRQEVQLG